jgi:hypothetical protein
MDYVLGLLSAPPAEWRPGTPEFDIIEKALEEVHAHALEAARGTLVRPGHRSGRPSPWHFAWGTGTVTQRYLDLVYARMQLGQLSPPDRQLLFDALSLCADYVLGARVSPIASGVGPNAWNSSLWPLRIRRPPRLR